MLRKTEKDSHPPHPIPHQEQRLSEGHKPNRLRLVVHSHGPITQGGTLKIVQSVGGLPIFEEQLIKTIQYSLREGFQGDNNIRDTMRSHVVWYQVERIESRMYPQTWWQCEFEGVMTYLAGDLVRTSTLESKNTGGSKLGTLLRGHLDQCLITYVEGMALAMLVNLCDSLALEVT